MRKLVPILTLTLCAFLLVTLATPIPARAFPHDNDRLDYEFKMDYLMKFAHGPPDYDYDIEVDISHVIQNSSGDLYWANVTATWVGPTDIFGPYTGLSNWTALLHHYQTGEIPQLIMVNPEDWSEYAPFWTSDLFFIEPGLVPGDSVRLGYSDSSGPPYENNSYMAVGIPVTQGPDFAVGPTLLNTVEIGLDYLYYANNTIYTGNDYWDMTVDFEIIWEWSLGFLCQINFDYYINLRPYDPWAPTEIFASGNLTLVDYSLTDTPAAYIGAGAGAAGLPIIMAAVAAVIIIVVIIIIFLYWRSRKGK